MPQKLETLVKDWEYLWFNYVTKGINLADRPDNPQDGYIQNALNISYWNKEARIDTGYSTYAGTVRGDPRRVYQFYLKAGTSSLVLVTNSTFYLYASSEWQYVSDGTDTTCTDGEPAGETNIVVADITGFSDADYIGIILDDGTQHQTTINGAPSGSTIVITDAIPAGRSVSVGAVLVKAVDLAGTAANPVDIVTVASHDWMVFTNGVDAPRRYDASTCEVIPNLPASGSFAAKAVAVYENYLCFYNCTEAGSRYPQRVRNSDTGDPTNWTTGNAGYEDLYDSEDVIFAAKPLGPYVAIYRERSIYRQAWIGTADLLFSIKPAVSGVGIVGYSALVYSEEAGGAFHDRHLFMGRGNFYSYDGGLTVEKIGTPIYDNVFSYTGNLSAAYQTRAMATYLEQLDEVWFMYPSGAATMCDRVAKYRVSTGAWSFKEPTHTFSGYGHYISEDAPIWTELTGTWAEQEWTWDSRAFQGSMPILFLCGDADDQVYRYDMLSADEDGTDISYELETGDIFIPNKYIRHDYVDAIIKGTSVQIWVSIDEGGSWTSLGTVSPGASYARQRMPRQIVSTNYRYKFTGTGGGFGFRGFGVNYREETEW